MLLRAFLMNLFYLETLCVGVLLLDPNHQEISKSTLNLVCRVEKQESYVSCFFGILKRKFDVA